MTHDDILKLKAVALYILNKCGETDSIHLFKIIYFAERSHYANYGKHLVKDTFCALERGPVPSFLYDAVKIPVHNTPIPQDNPLNLIAQAISPGEAECHYYIKAKEQADMDELSKAEIATIDECIEKYLHKTSSQLSAESHDIAWEAAWNQKHTSPIDPYLIAQAGGASMGFIDYLKEQEEIDKILN